MSSSPNRGRQEIIMVKRNEINCIRRIRPLNIGMAALILAIVGRSGGQPVHLNLIFLPAQMRAGWEPPCSLQSPSVLFAGRS
jgi:hypothetical protein